MLGRLKSRQHFFASLCIELILDLETPPARHFKAKQDMAVMALAVPF